ncbi:hypothetical protein [Aliarcobacter butzleri]|uniref:hypothetical protein n=1 Tax=Aliarcobacter butzleri TaxID=28197 RepID=UPI003AFB0A11
MPVILKGITSVSYAKKALDLGIDVLLYQIMRKNLDTLPASIELYLKCKSYK